MKFSKYAKKTVDNRDRAMSLSSQQKTDCWFVDASYEPATIIQ